MNLDLSIVIASYNTLDVTWRCLQSIFEQTKGLEFEVIVVDNASHDGSPDMIEAEFPQVVLIRNDNNAGFATAQNIGLQAAKGEFLLILNSDILFIDNPIKALIDYLRTADPKARIGVIGPQVINPDGTIAPSARRMEITRPMLALSLVNRYFNFKQLLPAEDLLRDYLGPILARFHDNYAAHDEIVEADFVDGMCALARRDALHESGLFDGQFFFDFEIRDLSARVLAAGWQIQFYPQAQVLHLGHASRKKVSAILVETHRSGLIYFTKHQPEDLDFLRSFEAAMLRLKLTSLKLALQIRGKTPERIRALKIYEKIQENHKGFAPESTFKNERIPRVEPYSAAKS